MTTKITPLYTAYANAKGGRNGHTKTEDGVVDFNLSLPKEMGGEGKAGATNPEALFAAGYAACFAGATQHMAQELKLVPRELEVRCGAGIGKDGEGFGLTVNLEVTVKGLSQQDAEKIVAAGHDFCPYSKAIKNNVEVALEVKAME